MTDDIHMRIADGSDRTLCDLITRLPQTGMHGRNYKVKRGKKFIGIIKRAIGFNLNFTSM
jgi:hypothetical protein